MWESSLVDRLSSSGPILLPVLLDAAAKGLIILVLTGLATLTMRRASAAARHLVWFLGTLSLLVLPILSAVLPGWHILPRWVMNDVAPVQQPAAPTVAPTPVPVSFLPDTQALPDYTPPRVDIAPAVEPTPAPIQPLVPQAPTLHLTWQGYALLASMAGSLLMLGHVALGVLSLWWLERRSQAITSGNWPVLLRTLRDRLGLRRPVRLLSSPRRTMPMTWGLWRTRLLLPDDSANWPADQRAAVLLHELSHARRCDCLTQFLTQIVCALYWFNPLVWLAWRRMQTEREQACDDLVLSTGDTKASAYAEQLLHIAAERPTVRCSTAAIAMARPSNLEGRLLAILDVGRNRRGLTWNAGLLAALLIGAFAVPLAMVRAGAPAPDIAPASPNASPSVTRTEPPRQPDTQPELRFLAYQNDAREQPLAVWRPTGESLAASDADRKVAERHHPVHIGKSPRDGQVLYLWFSHPQFDLQSVSQVRFLDPAGTALPNDGATVGSRAEAPSGDAASPGWVLYSTSPLPPGQTIPDTLQVELRYSVGDWKTGHIFPSDYHGATTIADGAMVNTVGQTADGRAFIVITRDPAKTRDIQYDFAVTTRDNKQLDRHLGSSSGSGNLHTDQYEFDLPLAQVKSFQLRERPIRTILFRDIAMRTGHATHPSTAPAATQPVAEPAAVLDFRIAVLPHGAASGLSLSEAVEAAALRDLAAHGPQPRPGFRWFAVAPEEISSGLLTGEFDHMHYALLADTRDATLLADRTGQRTWGLKRVYATKDNSGRPAIGFDFNDAGAERFGRLTESHLNQPLAILINDQVVNAPRIGSRISGSGIIAGGKGQYTPERVDELVRSLQRGMMPAAIRAPGASAAPDSRPAIKDEVSVEGVSAAPLKQENGALDVQVRLISTSTRPVKGTLALLENGQPLQARRITIDPAKLDAAGRITETFHLPAARRARGVEHIKATFIFDPDGSVPSGLPVTRPASGNTSYSIPLCELTPQADLYVKPVDGSFTVTFVHNLDPARFSFGAMAYDASGKTYGNSNHNTAAAGAGEKPLVRARVGLAALQKTTIIFRNLPLASVKRILVMANTRDPQSRELAATTVLDPGIMTMLPPAAAAANQLRSQHIQGPTNYTLLTLPNGMSIEARSSLDTAVVDGRVTYLRARGATVRSPHGMALLQAPDLEFTLATPLVITESAPSTHPSTRASTTQPAAAEQWGRAEQGIQVGIHSAKAQWGADENVALAVSLKNDGAAFTIADSMHGWMLELDGKAFSLMQASWEQTGSRTIGEHQTIDDWDTLVLCPTEGAIDVRGTHRGTYYAWTRTLDLAPGRHVIRVGFPLGIGQEPGNVARFLHPAAEPAWAYSNRLTIEVLARSASAPSAAPATRPTARPAAAGIDAVRLENAAKHLKLVEQRQQAGLATPLDYERAKWDLKILEAEQSGNPVLIARVRLDGAHAIFSQVDAASRAGLLPNSDVEVAWANLRLRNAESAMVLPHAHAVIRPATGNPPSFEFALDKTFSLDALVLKNAAGDNWLSPNYITFIARKPGEIQGWISYSVLYGEKIVSVVAIELLDTNGKRVGLAEVECKGEDVTIWTGFPVHRIFTQEFTARYAADTKIAMFRVSLAQESKADAIAPATRPAVSAARPTTQSAQNWRRIAN